MIKYIYYYVVECIYWIYSFFEEDSKFIQLEREKDGSTIDYSLSRHSDFLLNYIERHSDINRNVIAQIYFVSRIQVNKFSVQLFPYLIRMGFPLQLSHFYFDTFYWSNDDVFGGNDLGTYLLIDKENKCHILLITTSEPNNFINIELLIKNYKVNLNRLKKKDLYYEKS